MWGVVIETAHPGAVASLVVLADNSVSLYVSDGNGCVGCGSQREVRWAAADLLQIAENSLPLTAPTSDLTLPPEGLVRWYLLTRHGLRSSRMPTFCITACEATLSYSVVAMMRLRLCAMMPWSKCEIFDRQMSEDTKWATCTLCTLRSLGTHQ